MTRPNDYNANATDNSDNHIFSGFQVRDNAVFYMECWVKLDANSTAMAENTQISIGLSLQYQELKLRKICLQLNGRRFLVT